MLPACAGSALAGLPGLAIIRISGRVAISVEGLVDRLIIGPTSTANYVCQGSFAIRGNNCHAKILMIVVWRVVYPLRGSLQIAGDPAAIACIAVVVKWAEDHIVHPVIVPIEAVAGSVNHALIGAAKG